MKTLADLSEPSKVVRKLLEADVQKQCVDWARARGYWARKFSSIAQRSVPDYLFALDKRIEYGTQGKNGSAHIDIKFACEFKAPGKTSTDAQIEEQAAMRLAGWFVFECDNFLKFKSTVEIYEQEQA